MAAADRFGLCFSSANGVEPASNGGQKAKTLAKTSAARLDRIWPNPRANSCGIASRAETIIPRRLCECLLTTSGRIQYPLLQH
jgi:hypothetical protein